MASEGMIFTKNLKFKKFILFYYIYFFMVFTAP